MEAQAKSGQVVTTQLELISGDPDDQAAEMLFSFFSSKLYLLPLSHNGIILLCMQ